MIGLLGGPDLAAERVVDAIQGPVAAPCVEAATGVLGREVAGEIAPLAASAEDIEDGIDDVADVGLARPAAAGSSGRWGSIRAHWASVRSLG